MFKPLKVVHVIGCMNPGGAETWLMHVLRHIDRGRFHFTFCTLSGRKGIFDEEIQSLGASIVACPVNVGGRRFSRCFISLLREIHCDVLHSHVHFFSGWTLKLGTRLGIPIRIAHSHTGGDIRDDSRRFFYRFLMRRYIHKYATHGLGCSELAADILFAGRWRKMPGYQVLTCGIDTSMFEQPFDRNELCESLGIPSAATVVGHVGNFRPVKNHSFLLCIFAALMRKRDNIHLLLIGDGPLRREMEFLAEELGILNDVTFAGVQTDVPILMRSLFDLFIFPSHFEGLPLAILESQCAGVPCLISDIITEEVSVISQLVNRKSLDDTAEGWADEAIDILNRPRFDKGKALKELEVSKFSIRHNIGVLSALYSGSVSERS